MEKHSFTIPTGYAVAVTAAVACLLVLGNAVLYSLCHLGILCG